MAIEGSDEATAFKAIDALEAYFVSTGIPMTLSALNIGEEHFAAMAEHACGENGLDNDFVGLDKEDVINIYKMCL